MHVGLTGGIASGKTMVADALAARGAVVIDADVLAREVVEPGTPGLAAVVDRFGAEMVVGGRLVRMSAYHQAGAPVDEMREAHFLGRRLGMEVDDHRIGLLA